VVESTTQHYGWTKPEVTKSGATWGGFLNTNLDSIDALVFANQQGLVPIGAVTMFAGGVAPANWLICDGRSLSIAAPYDQLFAILQYAFGGSGPNFNLPNLVQKFPLGVGPNNALGSSGGTFSYTIATANLPPHAHPITDVAHGHGVNQWAHGHTIVTGNHAHSIVTGGHSHSISTGSHSHGGVTVPGGVFSLGQAGYTTQTGRTDTAGDLGGSASFVGNLGGNTDTAGNLGGYTDTPTSAISIQVSGTGLSTTQNVGSGAAITITPPFVAINFIVRYQ
jgi:microcystin-dependent protein